MKVYALVQSQTSRVGSGWLWFGLVLALGLSACATSPEQTSSTPSATIVWETPAPPTLSAPQVLAAQLKRLGFNIRGWT